MTKPWERGWHSDLSQTRQAEATLDTFVRERKPAGEMSLTDSTDGVGAKKPWERGWRAKASDDNESIIDEMHPQLSIKDRFIVKNFGVNNASSIGYLQKKHPNMDFRDDEGTILAKMKYEQVWRKLDPSGFDMQDISDIFVDVAAGFGSAGAAAAGGLAGAVGGVGMGALPAGMAAGAAASGGIELARQGIGSHLGIPNNISPLDVGYSTIAGGIAPGLFGTGAKVAGTAGKGLLKSGLTKAGPTLEAASLGAGKLQAAQAAQQGLLSRAAPKIATTISGAPEDALRALKKDYKQVVNMTEDDMLGMAEKSHAALKEGFFRAKDRIGKEIGRRIDGTKKKIDITDVKQTYQDAIDVFVQRQKTEGLTTIEREKLKSILAQYDDLFHTTVKTPAGKSQVYDFATGKLRTVDVGEKLLKKEIPDKISAEKAFRIKMEMSDLAETWRFGKGGLGSRFTASESVADRAAMELHRTAAKLIDEKLDAATGGVSKHLRERYREISNLQLAMNRDFTTPNQTLTTLSTLYGIGRKGAVARMARAKKLTGVDLKPTADKLSAAKFFVDPKWMPLSGGGSTSTSRWGLVGTAGAGLGAMVGGGKGAMAGGVLASTLSSPAVMRGATKGINIAQSLGRATRIEKPLRAAPIAAWRMARGQ